MSSSMYKAAKTAQDIEVLISGDPKKEKVKLPGRLLSKSKDMEVIL